MARYLLTILIILICNGVSTAQVDSARKDTLKISIKRLLDGLIESSVRPKPSDIGSISITSGLNFSKINPAGLVCSYSWPDNTDYSTKMGFCIGAEYNYFTCNKLEVSSGLFYSFHKFKNENFIFDFITLIYSEKLNIIKLPINIKFNFSKNHKLSPFIYTGISFDFISSAKGSIKVIYPELSSQKYTNYDIDILRKNFSIGSIMGFGFKYVIGSNYVTLKLNYNKGLRNIVSPYRSLDDPKLNTIYQTYYYDNQYKLNHYTFLLSFNLILKKNKNENKNP